MLDCLNITKQDDWDYFPVYTGRMASVEAIQYFERVRNSIMRSGDKEIVNKLRWVPSSALSQPEFENLNYLPYILTLNSVIEVNNKHIKITELEEIRRWFSEYIILKEEEATND